jgi:hypothetical protein
MIMVQAAVQPVGLLVLPVALLAAFPFGWTYAFYQNVTIMGDSGEPGMRAILQRAWKQAVLWPRQNHVIMWLANPWLLALGLGMGLGMVGLITHSSQLLGGMPGMAWMLLNIMMILIGFITLPISPFGFAIVGNISLTIIIIPVLMRAWLGVETVFTMNPVGSVMNTTFPVVVFCLSYLCMDPLIKAVYVLRCFYGESLSTGADLKIDLRLRKTTGSRTGTLALSALILLLLAPIAAGVQPTEEEYPQTVPPQELDDVISEVLARPEFSWRLPREVVTGAEDEEEGMFAAFFNKLGHYFEGLLQWIDKQLQRFRNWLNNRARSRKPADSGRDESAPWTWRERIQTLFFILLVFTACVLGILVFRLVLRRRQRVAVTEAEPIRALPDIADEKTVADELPSDEWTSMALELLARGELRLAIRAFHMACVAYLAGMEKLTIANYKSNRDYKAELLRRSHDKPDIIEAFDENVLLFERVWYGAHRVSMETVDIFKRNTQRVIDVTREKSAGGLEGE